MLLSFKIQQTIYQDIHQLTFEIGNKKLFFINKSDDSFGTYTGRLASSDKLLPKINVAVGRYILLFMSAQRETAATSLEVL